MAITPGQPLPKALREVSVLDVEGKPRALGEMLSGKTLLVFLRHYGCVHCSRQVDVLGTRLPELEDLGVRVVLVGSGPPVDMAAFCERQALSARPMTLVTDPSLAAYRAAEMERSLASVFSPRAILEEIDAMTRGYFPRRRAGDVSQLGGAILVDEDGRIAFHHAARRPGDLADVADIVDAVLRLVAARAAAHGRV